jgi:hypothetical protein
VPFDADEVWVAHGGRVGDVLDDLPDDILVARAPWLTHVVTDRDPPGPDPVARMVYRRSEFHHSPKVACRPRPGLWIVKGNHRAAYRGIVRPLSVDGLLCVRHFPVRSAEQFVRKVSYRADGVWRSKPTMPQFLPPEHEEYLCILKEEGEAPLAASFDEDHRFADPDEAGLVLDPCP